MWNHQKSRGVLICNGKQNVAYLAPRLRQYAASWCCIHEHGEGVLIERLGPLIRTADVIAMHADVSRRADVLALCRASAKPLLIIPRLSELTIAGARLSHLDDVLLLSIAPWSLSRLQQYGKRAIDIAGALTILLLTSPVFLLLLALIPLTSKGAALFKQERLGKDHQPFFILKFRTMIVDAERNTGPMLAVQNDPRITRLGRLLRATRLDELPQLLNVLSGEMSLVGPRPERACFVREFERHIPEYQFRMTVKPGITGLAQVRGRYDTSVENKLRLDILYIQRCSLLLDLKILLLTLLVVLRPEHAKGVPISAAPIPYQASGPVTVNWPAMPPPAAYRDGELQPNDMEVSKVS